MVRRLLVACVMVGILAAVFLGLRSYHSWWRAPAVDGQLTSKGQALPNAALFLQVPDFDSGLCEPPGQAATTDSRGGFHFPGTQEHEWKSPFSTYEHQVVWMLCATRLPGEASGGPRVLYEWRGVPNRWIRVTCDVSPDRSPLCAVNESRS